MESSDMELSGLYAVSYRTINLVSEKSWLVSDRTFQSRLHFLECLNQWNKMGKGNWLYYEELK